MVEYIFDLVNLDLLEVGGPSKLSHQHSVGVKKVVKSKNEAHHENQLVESVRMSLSTLDFEHFEKWPF